MTPTLYVWNMVIKVQSAKLRHKGKSSPVVLFRAQAFYIIFTPKELRGHCCKHFLLWYGLGGFKSINICGISLYCTILLIL